MKLAAVLIILALWIWYRHTPDSAPRKTHVAINCLYLAFMVGAAVMVP